MKISPIEIRQQEFTKKMRGYDPDEVQNFLESLAEELDKLKISLSPFFGGFC